MKVQVAADFFALMLLGGLAGVLLTFLPAVRSKFHWSGLRLAALVAIGATAGSLYFSEVGHLLPCELCWFQRIVMYSLAVLLGVAAIFDVYAIGRYALPLAVAGLALSLYHVQLQAFPDQGSFCELENPCSSSLVSALGWMTIPQMAAISFVLIIRMLWIMPPPKGVTPK